MSRRRRSRRPLLGADPEEGIGMSSLIDCVFLLLIFFLVTTMLKRKEMQIPIEVPDNTSSLAKDAMDRTLVVALDEDGGLYRGGEVDKQGRLTYHPLSDLALHLNEVVLDDQQALTRPLRIDVDHASPFHKSIDVIDICILQGFEKVSVKVRPPAVKSESERYQDAVKAGGAF